MTPPQINNVDRRRIACIGESYRRMTGRALVDAGGDAVEVLWSAPLAIVAHGAEPDPIFFFGNRTALALFEMDFDTFTRLPSRRSAEPTLQDGRARLLERVSEKGIVDDYTGVRISATGKRFRILNTAVWNVATETGEFIGQAAAFAQWAFLDGASQVPGRDRR